MKYNWLQHWEQNDIAFHQDKINPWLEKYGSQLAMPHAANILVPLCGKSQDMLWLAKQGLHVIGVELSQIACEAFFIENNLDVKTESLHNFTRYYSEQIEIFCGDFFALSKEYLPIITAVYDRAALIALPKELRSSYVQHLTQLMATGGKMLLIVFATDDKVQGPPYPVPHSELTQLFAGQFQITELERMKINPSPHLREKGYRELYELVYSLEKIDLK